MTCPLVKVNCFHHFSLNGRILNNTAEGIKPSKKKEAIGRVFNDPWVIYHNGRLPDTWYDAIHNDELKVIEGRKADLISSLVQCSFEFLDNGLFNCVVSSPSVICLLSFFSITNSTKWRLFFHTIKHTSYYSSCTTIPVLKKVLLLVVKPNKSMKKWTVSNILKKESESVFFK